MLTVETLRDYGADTETGMKRCMGNEALYIRLVGSISSDPGFDKIEEAIKAGDLDAAFETAHALKGVLGNLSLTPLYDKASEITELLRERKEMDYGPMLDALKASREELAGLMQ